MTKKSSIKVKALRYHTFAGTEYQEGDVYDVPGDETQTAEQYGETLRALGFAAAHDGTEPAPKGKEEYETREMKAKRR